MSYLILIGVAVTSIIIIAILYIVFGRKISESFRENTRVNSHHQLNCYDYVHSNPDLKKRYDEMKANYAMYKATVEEMQTLDKEKLQEREIKFNDFDKILSTMRTTITSDPSGTQSNIYARTLNGCFVPTEAMRLYNLNDKCEMRKYGADDDEKNKISLEVDTVLNPGCRIDFEDEKWQDKQTFTKFFDIALRNYDSEYYDEIMGLQRFINDMNKRIEDLKKEIEHLEKEIKQYNSKSNILCVNIDHDSHRRGVGGLSWDPSKFNYCKADVRAMNNVDKLPGCEKLVNTVPDCLSDNTVVTTRHQKSNRFKEVYEEYQKVLERHRQLAQRYDELNDLNNDILRKKSILEWENWSVKNNINNVRPPSY